MAKKNKIERGNIRSNAKKIPLASNIPSPDTLKVSFKYLDIIGNEKFSIAICPDGYLETFLDKLRELSRLKTKEFKSNRSSAWRSHPINFSETTEPNGFNNINEQVYSGHAWQFNLTVNKYGRIHGFLISDTFYVVWIDPKHKLYPSKNHK